MDKEIRQMKNDIINVLNEARLPIEVKRLVLAEVMSEVKEKANEVILNQIAETQEESEVNDNGD